MTKNGFESCFWFAGEAEVACKESSILTSSENFAVW